MKPVISYAMRNTEATQKFLSFNAPHELKDWSHLAIEWVVILGFVLACVHAYREFKQTKALSAIYTLLACFLYGLLMDIASYYTVENFWHGEFSVMFLFNKLPLYIALFYPAFIYHTYMTIHRYGFKPMTEAVSVGFFAGLGYMIFDNLGPMVGWWVWDHADSTTWPYLNNVPLTSYHWMFLFTGIFAFYVRTFCWNFVEQGKSTGKVLGGLFSIPVLTILTGALGFELYNAFAHRGMLGLASLFHGTVFFLAGMHFLYSYRTPAPQRDKLLMFFPLVYLAAHLFIFIAKWDSFVALTVNGPSADGLVAGNLFVIVLAIAACTAIVLLSHPVDAEIQTKSKTPLESVVP